jgi:glucosylceramidase
MGLAMSEACTPNQVMPTYLMNTTLELTLSAKVYKVKNHPLSHPLGEGETENKPENDLQTGCEAGKSQNYPRRTWARTNAMPHTPTRNPRCELKKILIWLCLAAGGCYAALAQDITIISTTPQVPWSHQQIDLKAGSDSAQAGVAIAINPAVKYQTMDGFGGCFNELGWEALLTLPAENRQAVMAALFDSKTGCGFEYGRMPIGASDFGKDWYSLDDTPGDYDLEHFSIQRDEQCLIPYIKAGLAVNPRLKIWGSAWSPPAWLKVNNNYTGGTNQLRFEPQVLTTYAHYLARYVQAYQQAGVPVYAVHVQNEPASAQKFPSCVWNGMQIRDFVRDYMGPRFKQDKVKAEIWLGTINNRDIESYVAPTLNDPKASQYIAGVGYQWDGKHAIAETHARWPGLKLMQTETECGGGENNWDSAVNTWGLLKHYLSNGASAYMYWNMVLDQKSISSWGWKQNAMITVHTDSHEVVYNPEFYLMKHFSAFVAPGATRIEATSTNAVAFKNRNGSIVIVTANLEATPLPVTINVAKKTFVATLPAQSFDTIIYR